MMSGGNVPPPNQIWYTTTDEQIITPSGFTILSNTYRNGVGRIVTNKKITSIPLQAFMRMSTLKRIYFVNENIEIINAWAFSGCPNLEGEFIFPKLTGLGSQTFGGTKITYFEAPLLKSIRLGDLSDTNYLKTVKLISCEAMESQSFIRSKVEDLWLGNVIPSRDYYFPSSIKHIYVPADRVDDYKASSSWSSFATKIYAYPE